MRKTLVAFLLCAILCLAGCSKDADQLTAAVKSGDKQTIDSLVAKNPRVINKRNSSGRTPLIEAVQNGNIEMITYLLDKKADINERDKNGLTPLHYTILGKPDKGQDIATLLLDRGADVNAKSNEGATPYGMAKQRGDMRGAAFVISRRGGTE